MKIMLHSAYLKLCALYWCAALLLLKPWKARHERIRWDLWDIIWPYSKYASDESDYTDIKLVCMAAKVKGWEFPSEKLDFPF